MGIAPRWAGLPHPPSSNLTPPTFSSPHRHIFSSVRAQPTQPHSHGMLPLEPQHHSTAVALQLRKDRRQHYSTARSTSPPAHYHSTTISRTTPRSATPSPPTPLPTRCPLPPAFAPARPPPPPPTPQHPNIFPHRAHPRAPLQVSFDVFAESLSSVGFPMSGRWQVEELASDEHPNICPHSVPHRTLFSLLAALAFCRLLRRRQLHHRIWKPFSGHGARWMRACTIGRSCVRI